MVLPDRRLFPLPVDLGQNMGIRDLKATEAQLKAPQNFSYTEGTFPTASSLLSTNVLLSHLNYTLGQLPQEETYGCVDLEVGQVSTWNKPTVNARTQPVSELEVRHGCLVSLDKPPIDTGRKLLCHLLKP